MEFDDMIFHQHCAEGWQLLNALACGKPTGDVYVN